MLTTKRGGTPMYAWSYEDAGRVLHAQWDGRDDGNRAAGREMLLRLSITCVTYLEIERALDLPATMEDGGVVVRLPETPEWTVPKGEPVHPDELRVVVERVERSSPGDWFGDGAVLYAAEKRGMSVRRSGSR